MLAWFACVYVGATAADAVGAVTVEKPRHEFTLFFPHHSCRLDMREPPSQKLTAGHPPRDPKPEQHPLFRVHQPLNGVALPKNIEIAKVFMLRHQVNRIAQLPLILKVPIVNGQPAAHGVPDTKTGNDLIENVNHPMLWRIGDVEPGSPGLVRLILFHDKLVAATIRWFARAAFALYLMWSIVDMGIRFASTKPGSHSISVSTYVGFSAGWAAPAAFWAMILVFYSVTLVAHLGFYSGYYGVSITSEESMPADVVSRIAAVPDGGETVPGATQFLSGMTGTETTGNVGNVIKWLLSEIALFINLPALVEVLAAFVVFVVLRQALYTVACSVSIAVAMAL